MLNNNIAELTEKLHKRGSNHTDLLQDFSELVNASVTVGTTIEDLVNKLGGKILTQYLHAIENLELAGVEDSKLVSIVSALNYLLVNNHISETKEWVSKAYSKSVWLRLSKLYLKHLFSTYPKFTREYEELLKSKHGNHKTMIEKVVDQFNEKLASLSFDVKSSELQACEKLLENIVVSVSMPQSRLITVMLLADRQLYITTRLFLKYLKVKLGEKEAFKLATLESLCKILKRFVNFDIMGESRVARRTVLVHYDVFQEFQRLLFHHFSEKVEHYVIKAVGNADTREKLKEVFSYLTEPDLRLIANKLNIFVPDDDDQNPVLAILTEESGFKLLIEEVLVFKLQARRSVLDKVRSTALFPNEKDLIVATEEYKVERSYGIDRLTMSFVNVEDYLIRHFELFRRAFASDVSSVISQVVSGVAPIFDPATGLVKQFDGWNIYSLEIKNFTVFNVTKPKVGSKIFEKILAEVQYSTIEVNTMCKKEWEKTQAHDDVFLLAFNKKGRSSKAIDNELDEKPGNVESSFEKAGLVQVRGSELVSHLDEERSKINLGEFRIKRDIKPRGVERYLQFHLDPNQYSKDMETGSAQARQGLYNMVVRRSTGSINYHAYLKLLVKCLENNMELSDWVSAVVAGKQVAEDKLDASPPLKITLPCTHHVSEAVNRTLKSTHIHVDPIKDSKKHLDEQQAEAVARASREGLLLVDGPPGTGKTEVIAQIISQSLQRSPDERVIMVTKTESAVEELLRRVVEDGHVRADEIIQLNHSEITRENSKDFTRFGRVNHLLRRRIELLEEAEKISAEIGLDLYSKLTCETAEILFKSQVDSRWKAFVHDAQKGKKNGSDYPFSRV